jgi:cytochrome c peroxidase
MPRDLARHAVKKTLLLGLLLFCVGAVLPATALGLTSLETLGKKIYVDRTLSDPNGQACSDCHLPSAGRADPDQGLPVSEGVVPKNFGGRNSPTAAYAAYSPVFQWNAMKGMYVGGQFWDGRAADLVAQAKGPFLNPVEMHNPDKATVVDVKNGSYAALFRKVFGSASLNNAEAAYDKIATAIAGYEKSTEVNAFSSKYDAIMTGRASFTALEQQGRTLFAGRGSCATCHGCGVGGMSGGGMSGGGCGVGANAVFTDFSYRNLGVPRNTAWPLLAAAPVDLGLGATVHNSAQDGKFKVPTLRNVAATAPYTHNGSFTTLRELIDFYNTRDVPGAGRADPEVDYNLSGQLGDLGLSDGEIDAIVAFLNTLTDGYGM